MSRDPDLEELGVVYLEGGPPPPELVAALEAYRAAHPRVIVPTTTARADRFFAGMAEEIKRAGGAPR